MRPGLKGLAVCVILGGAAASFGFGGAAHAKGLEVLYRFCSQQNCTDGLWPYAGVLKDKEGNLYGTTGAGGATCRLYGCGTVFKLTPDGVESVLHAFTAEYDGSGPYGGLIEDGLGNFYGTTATGGSTGCGGIDYGCGTVFKVSPDGSESIVYAFGGNRDGAYPLAGLASDKKGDLYSTTTDGGGGAQCIVQFGGCGTVFRVNAKGKEKILYAFTGGSDGANPQASLLIDKTGNLFGTAAYGGNTSACNQGNSPGCGTVFEVAADGAEKTLYTFNGGNDGWAPIANLIEDKSGNLYGATQAGGSTTACNGVGCGTIFRIAPDGTETILYSFAGASDGAHPAAGVIADSNGNLYGVTEGGGSGNEGTVFKLTPNGKLIVLNAFDGQGDAPVANLTFGKKGALFGTTEFGPDGVVFKVKK